MQIFQISPFSRWDRTSIATQEDLAQLVRTCTRCCREIEGYEKEIEEFSALGNQLARTSGDPTASGGAGVKTVLTSITTIQKKFESLKQEFTKDSEDLDNLLTQLQLVEAKKVEAQNYLEGLESKLKDARTSAMSEESPSELFNQLSLGDGNLPNLLAAAVQESDRLAEMNGESKSMEIFASIGTLVEKWDSLQDEIMRLQTEAKARQAEAQERKSKVQRLSQWVNSHGKEVNCDDLRMQSTEELQTYLEALKTQQSDLKGKAEELSVLASSLEKKRDDKSLEESLTTVKTLASQVTETITEVTSRIRTAEIWTAKANKYNSIKKTYVTSMTSTREKFQTLVKEKDGQDDLLISVLNNHCDQLDELIQEHSDNTHVQEILLTAEEMSDAGVPTAVVLNFKKSVEELANDNERLFRELQEMRNRLRQSLDYLADHEKRSAALDKWLKEQETMVNNFKHASTLDEKFLQINTFKIVCESAVSWEAKFCMEYKELMR